MRTTGESSPASGCFHRLTRCVRYRVSVIAAGCCLFLQATVGLAAPQLAAEPSYLIKTWQTEDGLPDNSATAMVQTPDDYLWFGTFNGLVRFDGVKFTVFDTGNTPELPSSSVVNLHLDRNGRLWVSTLRGLVVREGTRWRPIPEAATKDGDYIRSFADRANGDVLMTLSKGRILEFAGDRCSELPAPRGEANSGYLGFSDEEGRWWVAQRVFVGTWNGMQWVSAPAVTNVPLPEGFPIGFAPARDGGFWLLVNSDLRKYSRGRQVSVCPISGSLGSISRMAEDSAGSVWIATYDAGLTQILPDGRIQRWGEANGIAYKDVRFVFEDKEQNLWVGTSGGGLQQFKPRRFQAFGYTQGAAARLVGTVAASPDGSVWATTFGQGLFRWHPEDGFGRHKPPSWADHNLHFTSVLADRKGRTWVGVYDDGLLAFGAGYDRHFTALELGGATVNALFEDSRGRIWISAGPGVAAFEEGKFQIYDQRSGLPSGIVCAMAEDADGVLWLSNLEGVFRLNSGRCEPVLAEDGSPLREVTCLKADNDRTMWMGTSDRGLLRWRAGSLKKVDAQAGLPVRSIYGMLEDQRGFFWMTAHQGIVRAHRSALESVAEGRAAKLACQLLDTSDGLPSTEFPGQRQPVCARDNGGRFWFATRKGVAMTDPERFQINATPPLVQIESVSYVPASVSPGQRVEPTRVNAPLPESLDLPAGSSEIEVHYTALSFAAPERVVFQVKTEGQDSDWRDRGGARMERLHSLPPRRYVFHVRAANNDGVRNEDGTSLAFTILPYYWQTAWFRVGSGSLLIASGAALAWLWSRKKFHLAAERERVAEERRRAEIQTQQLREELAHSCRVSTMGELATSVAHELNQPLGAILSNAEAAELFLKQDPPPLGEIQAILADIRKDDERAGEVIRRMRTLLKKNVLERQPLELSSVAAEALRLVSAKVADSKTVVVGELSPHLPPVAGDRIQLQQVLLNLILNALDALAEQPPEKRRIVVRASHNGDRTVELSVHDSGPGVDPAKLPRLFEPFFTTKQSGLGMGLTICRRIVEAHHGHVWAENHPDGGTIFRVTLPVATEQSKS